MHVAEQTAADYYLAALVLFTLFRFLSTYLMQFFPAHRMLGLLAFCAIVLTVLVIFVGGPVGVYALVGISGCMSLMYPTIYGLSVSPLGTDTKLGSSFLVMAILGGAVITAVQGKVSDMTGSIHYAFFVPMICFVVIAYYALGRGHAEKS